MGIRAKSRIQASMQRDRWRNTMIASQACKPSSLQDVKSDAWEKVKMNINGVDGATDILNFLNPGLTWFNPCGAHVRSL